MTALFLEESFLGPSVDPRLSWMNPPPSFRLGNGLELTTAAGSDLWQRTHYGFTPDSGHALMAELEGDFEIETSVSFRPVHQYDQAGLLVRLSSRCWLKTSIEFEPELELESGSAAARLGSVVTNDAWSDWATQNVAASVRSARYRITRRAGDYLVEHADPEGRWTQIRLAHLHEDDGTRPIAAGVYACSPKAAGFAATFHSLRVILGSSSAS